MKVFNILFSLLFLIFAGLQYNDPDPYIWIPIYLYAAALCWLAFRNKFYPAAYLFGIAIYAAYALYLFDGVLIDSKNNPICRHEGELPDRGNKGFFGLGY
jgi:hypothetical protein